MIERATTRLLCLGFATAVAQACLLREAMAALGGSELAWGGVLFAWLVGMGLGSALAARWYSRWLAAFAPTLVTVASGAGVVLLRALPALMGASAGEAPSSFRGVLVWLLAVLPAAGLGGAAFPLSAASLVGDEAGGRAYGLESTGAVLGGVCFTFALAPLGSAGALAVALGALSAVELAVRKRVIVAVLVLLLGLAAARPLAAALAAAAWRWSRHPGELAAWRETRRQRLEVTGGEPRSVYANGRLLASFPDPYRTRPRAHLALLCHPGPHRVLLVGGLADGSFLPMLEHPITTLELLEEDPEAARMLPQWLGAELAYGLRDPRVVLLTGDPLRVVGRGGPWDLIVLLDPDPTTLRANRTRTAELFQVAARRLAPGGLLVVRVGVGDTYLEGLGGELLEVIAASLRASFPVVAAAPAEEVLLIAGGKDARIALDRGELLARWRARGVRDQQVPAETVGLLVDPGRVAALAARIASRAGSINTIDRPLALPLAVGLLEGRNAPWVVGAARVLAHASGWFVWMLLVVSGAVLVVGAGHGRGAGVVFAAAVGFASMAWWLVLLAAWQLTLGSVYAEIGGLSAAFMAGVAATSLSVRRRFAVRRCFLPMVFALAGMLSFAISSGLPLAWPRLTVVPLLLLGGVVTGAAFPAIVARAGPHDGALGRVFGGDEVGAGLAALIVGVVALPALGVRGVALALAVVLAVAAAISSAATRRAGSSDG
jgi:predicted membrane-bound spermidine synthase